MKMDPLREPTNSLPPSEQPPRLCGGGLSILLETRTEEEIHMRRGAQFYVVIK